MTADVVPCHKCGSTDIELRRYRVHGGYEYYARCKACLHSGPRVYAPGEHDMRHYRKAIDEWQRTETDALAEVDA